MLALINAALEIFRAATRCCCIATHGYCRCNQRPLTDRSILQYSSKTQAHQQDVNVNRSV